MPPHTRPEPMNASPHHAKVKLTLHQADTIFVSGTHVTGKMEMECRADQGLGIGVMMVELFATQELTSRDHSATSTFLHTRRLFQGPGLPPSNAVQAHPLPGDPPLPGHHYQARRGISTFLFRIPLPASSPPSISFGADLATIKYELRASVSVYWKGEKKLVTCNKDVQVVESFEEDMGRQAPEGVVVGEYGKIWVQGKVVGGIVVAGESACVELQVKNHSSKKNTALTVTLTRTLVLPNPNANSTEISRTPILEVSDMLTIVSFKGAEYTIAPGGEGVASLVFDIPEDARGVRGGALEGGEGDEDVSRREVSRFTESLFEIRCAVDVKIGMGFGNKDINLEIPVQIVHPAALPQQEQPYPYLYSHPHPYSTPSPPVPAPYSDPAYIYPPLPLSPIPNTYMDHNANPTHIWLPPPTMSPLPSPHPYTQPYQYPYYAPSLNQGAGQQIFFSPPPPSNLPVPMPMPLYLPARPLSAGAAGAQFSSISQDHIDPDPGLTQPHFAAPDARINSITMTRSGDLEPEEGKGERAERVARHLRLSSRHRSVSPMSHRFPGPPSIIVPQTTSNPTLLRNLPQPPIKTHDSNNLLSISVPSNTLTAPEPEVHSPRPVISPKHSFSVDLVTRNSIIKSERVEVLERMAAEVGRTMGDLSVRGILGSSGDAGVGLDVDMDAVVNKTLPPPPLPSGKARVKKNRRTRVDTYFTNTGSGPQPDLAAGVLHPISSDKTPPTPTLTAVTPFKLQLQRSSTQNTHLLTSLNGTRENESGLDALERRLLAEVGTRKLDKDPRPDVRDVLGVQPIAIPVKSIGKEAESLNDSAISSLTLAGVGEREFDREMEVEVEVEDERLFGLRNEELDEKHERDSDEKTHRAARSSVSGDERAEVRRRRKEERRRRRERDGGARSKSPSEKGRKNKKKDKEREKESESSGAKARKCAAAKGRVSAWLGEIDPDVPPLEDVPSSPRDMEDFTHVPVLSPIPASATEDAVQSVARDIAEEAKENVDDDVEAQKQTNVSSAPNPRSSGFVPIGILKHDTFLRRPVAIAKDTSVAEDARRIADIWSLPSSPAKGDSHRYTSPPEGLSPVLSPPPGMLELIRKSRRMSSPSSSTPTLHTSGEITRVLNEKKGQHSRKPLEPITKSTPPPPPLPRKKVIQPSSRLLVFPPPRLDPEVKYDIRSARGGRGGHVTAVASIWGSGTMQQKNKKTPDFLSAPTPKYTRSPLLTSNANGNHSNSNSDSSSGTKLVEQSRKLLTARKPLVKSSSVPAVISSSHATPMLSSTASLARPPLTSPSSPYKVKHAVKVPMAIVDNRSDGVGEAKTTSKVIGAKSTAAGGDLAFGQARLRDLIKKYQGTAL